MRVLNEKNDMGQFFPWAFSLCPNQVFLYLPLKFPRWFVRQMAQIAGYYGLFS